MINQLSIEKFRGFRSLQIDGMKRITLISGRNNVGKSTLLEALFLMMDHTSSDSFSKINGFRGSALGETSFLWEPLFFQLDTNQEIKICIQDETGLSCLTYRKDKDYLPYLVSGVPDDVLAAFRSYSKNYYTLFFAYDHGDYQEEGHFFLNGVSILREMKTSLPGSEIRFLRKTRWLNSTVTRLSDNVLNDVGNLELKGNKEKVIDVLRELDHGIEDILTLSIQGVTQLYLKAAGKFIPIHYAGDGVLKLLQICIAAMELQDGLLLIDEIESGFHYSMYGKLWTILDRISSVSNCQIIATTHSYEMISAVRGRLEDTGHFTYYRLGQSNQEHAVYQYNYDMLDHALEAELEVR